MEARELIARIQQAGIGISYDHDIPNCYTRLDNSGYNIVLGQAYLNGSEEQQLVLLRHELGHVVRGDCLLDLKHLSNQFGLSEGEAHRLSNIAIDSQINETLDHEVVRSLKGVLYSDLREHIPELPPYLPGWRPTFECLCKHQHAHEGGMCGGSSKAEGLPEGKAREIHVRTALRVKADPDLKEIGEIGISPSAQRSEYTVEPMPIPVIGRIFEKIRSLGALGSRLKARTYSRPGRVPGLKGVARIPHLKVAVAADCSGSTEQVKPILIGASQWLSRMYDVELYEFDTECRRHRGGDWPSGGGTAFQPVYRATKGCDILVMITDGFASDITPLPECPIIWVLLPQGAEPELRSIDRLIKL